MRQIGIALVSGANSQWLKTAFVIKGEIKDMPRNMTCIVYRQETDKKMHHTGIYTGNGDLVHAKGHDYGVVREAIDKLIAKGEITHYGIPCGLYSTEELKEAGIDPGLNIPILRRGSEGKYVQILQQALNNEIGAGLTVDGVFGNNTEEALKKYQAEHKLTADGVCGPKTWAELGYVSGEPENQEDSETVVVNKAFLCELRDALSKFVKDLAELVMDE